MRLRRTTAFVVLALLVGGIASQLPSALADESDNPFTALWDAIFDLQSRDDSLQAQIDELRAERDALAVQAGSEPTFVSNLYANVEVEATEDGRTLVHIAAGNSGPDRAAGVKLTAFYQMPLFEINSIDGSLCEDKSRGIIECILGTLEEGQESAITIDATPRESGQVNTWTVDISTTTEDSDFSDNHVTYDFETGSAEPLEAPQVEQPEEEPEVQEPEVEEPQQDAGEPTNSIENKEPQESTGNQTTAEPEVPSGNQTASEKVADNSNTTRTETEESESGGDKTSNASEETVNESNTNSSSNETEDAGSQPEEVPEETSEEQSEEPTQEQSEEQGATGEGVAEESSEESSEDSGEEGAEESQPEEDAPESEQEESDESSESG